MERASVARFWGTTPRELAKLPQSEYRRMREFTARYFEAQKKAQDDAQMGLPTPGRGKARKQAKPADIDDF